MALLRHDREAQQPAEESPAITRRCALWTVLFLADDPDGRAAAWQVLLACPHSAGRRGLLTLLAEAARDVHIMTEAAAAGVGAGGLAHHTYTDLLTLALPAPPTTAGDAQQQQQAPHLLRHPLARLAAWQLALLALAADADGGLGMPPPAVPRPRQPSFSSPRQPHHAYDPVYTQSPFSTSNAATTSTPFVAVTPELPRAVLGLALAGPGARSMLRRLGAFARGAGLVASLHGGDNRHLLATQPALGEEALGVGVTLLAALAEDSPPADLHATASLAALASRRVVEAAALYYPRPAALLYARFLASCPEPSVAAAVLRALVERALDAGAMAAGDGGAAAANAQQYAGGRSTYQSAAAQQHAQQTQRRLLAAGARPLLGVLQAVLSVGEDAAELQVFRLQQTLPLVERCSRLLSRRGGSGGSGALPHELDLVYEVARMFTAVAAANPTAAAFIAANFGGPLAEWRRLLTGRQGGWYEPSRGPGQ